MTKKTWGAFFRVQYLRFITPTELFLLYFPICVLVASQNPSHGIILFREGAAIPLIFLEIFFLLKQREGGGMGGGDIP